MAEHAAQAMRFGNDLEACLKAIQIGFELSPRPSDSVYQGAVKTLEMVQPLSLFLSVSLSASLYKGHAVIGVPLCVRRPLSEHLLCRARGIASLETPHDRHKRATI